LNKEKDYGGDQNALDKELGNAKKSFECRGKNLNHFELSLCVLCQHLANTNTSIASNKDPVNHKVLGVVFQPQKSPGVTNSRAQTWFIGSLEIFYFIAERISA
jgi:hypothetical protein